MDIEQAIDDCLTAGLTMDDITSVTANLSYYENGIVNCFTIRQAAKRSNITLTRAQTDCIIELEKSEA